MAEDPGESGCGVSVLGWAVFGVGILTGWIPVNPIADRYGEWCGALYMIAFGCVLGFLALVV